jgi:soluble lytic murein transglycosylase-like protein
VIDDLERLLKRGGMLLLLAVPLLIKAGLSTGSWGAASLDLPDYDLSDRPGRVHRVVSVQELQGRLEHANRVQENSRSTYEVALVYATEVAPLERALSDGFRISAPLARRVSWSLVEHSNRLDLDPSMAAAVMIVESGGNPRATSPVGAQGLMQVMPFWAGNFRECGRDLYNIEENLCHGMRILRYYLDTHRGDERRALLGYNGCVRGTNTPDCHRYPDKVAVIQERIERSRRIPF